MRYLLSALLFIAAGTQTFAQSDKYVQAMTSGLELLDKANTAEELVSIANRFERIAIAEKTEWLPWYYSAFARSLFAYYTTDKAKIDEVLDVAQKHIDMADSLSPNNSEITLLKGMILSGRIMVDPMSRGMQYGMQSGMLMNQARQQDPENPRSYYMIGQSLFYTPAEFGGGKEAGCEMLQKGKEKYTVFEPASEIHPDWGEKQLIELLQQCENGTVGE